MCGIGLLLSFPSANPSTDDTVFNSNGDRNSGTGSLHAEVAKRTKEINQQLAKALSNRGPDIPFGQCYFGSDLDNSHDFQVSCENDAQEQQKWSLHLHASVLHMRGTEAVAQPMVFPLSNLGMDKEDNNKNLKSFDGNGFDDFGECALCWNGECYTYQDVVEQAAFEEKQGVVAENTHCGSKGHEKIFSDQNNEIVHGRMIELIDSSTSPSQSSTQSSASDTTLVKNLLAEAIVKSMHSIASHAVSSRSSCGQNNLCNKDNLRKEHEAITRALSRIHGEYSFLLFVPSFQPIQKLSSFCSANEKSESFVATSYHEQPGFIYYGRDFLGRRSLLINKSMKDCVVISSVAMDTSCLQGSCENGLTTTFNKHWEELSPGIVYKMDVLTREVTKIPIPKVVNKELLEYTPLLYSTLKIDKQRKFHQTPVVDECDVCVNEESVAMISESESDLAAKSLLKLLDRAVLRRVMIAPNPKSQSPKDASVAILFSGGLDSVVLAALSHRHVPSNKPIDLINVSFYGGSSSVIESGTSPNTDGISQSPDRLAAILSYREMQRRWPTRCWNFITVDVPYAKVLEWEAHILRLISPLESTMDFNIATAFWFAGRGRGRVLTEENYETAYGMEDTSNSELAQNPSLRFAECNSRLRGSSLIGAKNDKAKNDLRGNGATVLDSTRCTELNNRSICVRNGCTRPTKPGCIFGACKFCCGKLQGPISSYLGRSARICPFHNDQSTDTKKNISKRNGHHKSCDSSYDRKSPRVTHSRESQKNCHEVTSGAKILLSGVGADEQMAGYSRHRTTFQRGGYGALRSELEMETNRLWTRNLGRDDRCISDHGKEVRFPFLDEDVVEFLRKLPLEQKCNLNKPQGEGDKEILRKVAVMIGVEECSTLVKRAIQFGSRIAKVSDKSRFGSCRRATGSTKHVEDSHKATIISNKSH